MLAGTTLAVLALAIPNASASPSLAPSARGIEVTRGPYLQLGTPTSVVVRWRTSLPVTSTVWYGGSPDDLSQSIDDSSFTFDHGIEISGLAPATKYYYAVGAGPFLLAGGDDEHFFITQPPVGDDSPTRIWVLGDSGTAGAEAAAVRDAYYAYAEGTHTDFWLMLGDNAYVSGTDSEYQDAVFEMYPEMLRKSVLWPTRGNHDVFAFVYYGIFTLPTSGQAGGMPSGTEAYYSFDHGNVHVVCLDSFGSNPLVGGAMMNWLEADLAATDQDWIVAYWHHPPYSKGSHDSDDEFDLILLRTQFLPILEAGGVDVVLSGHSHSYERSYLIDGHYGFSGSFGSQHLVDSGDGREVGDGAYRKQPGSHAGTVYTVAGCSGKVSSSNPLDHPVMFHSEATLGSVVIDVDGGRMDLTFLTSTGAMPDRVTLLQEPYSGTYCVPSTSSQGCQAFIATSGTPSISSPQPFEISAEDVVHQNPGLLYYGLDSAQLPFGDGFRCVASPTVRLPIQSSGGTGACGGSFSFDFNAYVQGQSNPSTFLGVEIFCQYWYRDPGSVMGSAMTDALQFQVGP